jgi:hypothetical protein
VAIPLAGSLAVLAVGLLAWPYTVDDAFITARYAQNLVAGLGYAMNPHVPSDGVTGPLALLPAIIALALGGDPVAAAKGTGLASCAVAVWLMLARLRRRAGGRVAAPAAAALIAASPSLGTWAVGGLETGLATLLVCCAALAATRRKRPAALALGGSIAALAWLRPELAPACAVLLGHAALRDRRAGGVAFGIALAGALALIAFRLALFGDALPLSLRAKPPELGHGVRYVLSAIALSTTFVGVVLALWGVRRGQRQDRVFGAVLLAHAGTLVLAGGDWMPGYRLLVPVLPLYAALAGIGASLRLTGKPWRVAACVLVAALLPLGDMATRIPELRANAAHRAALAPLVHTLAREAHTVALLDVGYLAYASGVRVVDLGGLTDPQIARMPGGHIDKRIDAAYLRARNPDTIVLHGAAEPRFGPDGELRAFDGYPVEQRVAAMDFVRSEFRVRQVVRYAPGYLYIVLTRASSGHEAIGDREQRHADQIE